MQAEAPAARPVRRKRLKTRERSQGAISKGVFVGKNRKNLDFDPAQIDLFTQALLGSDALEKSRKSVNFLYINVEFLALSNFALILSRKAHVHV